MSVVCSLVVSFVGVSLTMVAVSSYVFLRTIKAKQWSRQKEVRDVKAILFLANLVFLFSCLLTISFLSRKTRNLLMELWGKRRIAKVFRLVLKKKPREEVTQKLHEEFHEAVGGNRASRDPRISGHQSPYFWSWYRKKNNLQVDRLQKMERERESLGMKTNSQNYLKQSL